MDISILKVFTGIAEGQTFREMAEAENMSQSSISRAIAMLEEELGTPLFLRAHRSVQLTEAGEIFYSGLKELLPAYEYANHAIRNFSNTTCIRCCIVPNALQYDFGEIITDFKESTPGTLVSVVELPTFAQAAAELENGNLDYIIIHRPLLGPFPYDYDELICNDMPVVIFPLSHPLARRASVNFSDLREELILTTPYFRPVLGELSMLLGCTLRHIESLDNDAQATCRLLQRVAHRRGISICYENDLAAYRLDRVAVRALRGIPVTPLILVSRKGTIHNAAHRQFTIHLKEAYMHFSSTGQFC